MIELNSVQMTAFLLESKNMKYIGPMHLDLQFRTELIADGDHTESFRGSFAFLWT